MNLRKISTRLVVAGATTALAAGALVGVSSTAANAATGSADYTCTNPLSPSPVPVSVTATGEIPVNSLPTGTSIGGLAIPVGLDFSVPAEVANGLKTMAGVNKVGVSGATFALALGSENIPISSVLSAAPEGGTAGQPVVPVTDGPLTVPTTGAITEVSTPAPGTYAIALPGTFNLDLSTDGLLPTFSLACVLNEGENADIIPFEVTKQGATITGKAPKSVKKNKSFPVTVTVTGNNVPATGTVVASEKGKQLGTGKLKNGKATITIKGIKKPGLHTIDLSYKGDNLTEPASGGMFVTVKK